MTRLQRLQEALRQTKADALLITSDVNQRYLSDFSYSDGCQLITAERAFLLTDPRYAEAARSRVSDFTVLVPNERQIHALAKLIKQEGISCLAIEEKSLSFSDFQEYEKEFSCSIVSGASALLGILRRQKTPEELARIVRAQELTDRAFSHILGMLSPRMTEREVALELEFFMRRNGAEGAAFETIAVSGSASSLPHGVPRDLPLQAGFLTMDFGARVDGYCSDMTRTVVLGRADEEMRKVYQTVLNAQRAALDFLAEGIVCREADAVAREVIARAGYGPYFSHSLGHGIGMLVHEAPSFSRAADPESRLGRGNVMSVEPGIYLEGRFGVRIEDMIAVDENGIVRNLTKSPKELIEL